MAFVLEPDESAPAPGRFVLEPETPARPGNAITRAYRAVSEPVTSALTTMLEQSSRIEHPAIGQAARDVSEMVIPQTPIEAGAMVGTGGAGGLAVKAGLRPGMAALSRITGGLIGGETGGQVSGETTGRGALIGGGGAAGGEAVGSFVSKLLRSLPGAKARIAEQDAATYGRQMGAQSPPLAGAKNAADLQRMAAGEGQARLGTAKGAANEEINARAGMLEVPSVAPTRSVPGHRTTATTEGVERVSVPGHTYTERGRYDPEMQRWVSGDRAVPVPGHAASMPTTRSESVAVPGHSFREPMTFQQANDALSEIGARAFSKNPLDRTVNGVDQRRLYGQVYNEIKAALDRSDPSGALSAMFERTQADYARGLALIRPLQKSGAFRTGDALQFNTPHFQKMLADPKAEAALRNKLGDEGFVALRAAMLRGGQPGEVDRLASGSGRPQDALMQWLRGTNTGFTQTIGVPVRTIVPNVGSQYAGRAPFSLPPQLQAILDVALQKAGGTALTPERRP